MLTVDTSDEGIHVAVDALRNDEVIAYPTETIYGLGCNPYSPSALNKLFDIKQRADNSPVLLLIGERSQLDTLVSHISNPAKYCIDTFWPGPLSLLLPAAPGLHESIVGPDGKVCVRHTSSPIASELCRTFGNPIVSTSANLSGQPPATSCNAITLQGISVCINDGLISEQLPSTVYDPDTETIFREGSITKEKLKKLT